jgi:hypothetical protein
MFKMPSQILNLRVPGRDRVATGQSYNPSGAIFAPSAAWS